MFVVLEKHQADIFYLVICNKGWYKEKLCSKLGASSKKRTQVGRSETPAAEKVDNRERIEM